MVSSHVSVPGSPTHADRILHKAVWIDGAFYFVALSGLVAGLVHRRIVERQGFSASARKLGRRAGFIYLVQIGLVLATICVATWRSSAQLFHAQTFGDLGGFFPAIVRILLLKDEPNFTGVLPMYVIFLLLAIPAVYCLQRGWWLAVVGGSCLIYLVGKGFGGYRFADWGGSFDPTGWQLLFIAGLLVGWTWEHEMLRIPPQVMRRLVIAAAIVFAGFLTLALTAAREVDDLFGPLLTKFPGGPLAFVFVAAALITAYAVVDWSRHWPKVNRALRPLEILGVKGLPGYVAMVLTILVFACFPGVVPRNDLTVVIVVIVAGLAEWGAWKRDQRRRSRAAAARPAPAMVPGLAAPPTAAPATTA
jgi:hypothetical protein